MHIRTCIQLPLSACTIAVQKNLVVFACALMIIPFCSGRLCTIAALQHFATSTFSFTRQFRRQWNCISMGCGRCHFVPGFMELGARSSVKSGSLDSLCQVIMLNTASCHSTSKPSDLCVRAGVRQGREQQWVIRYIVKTLAGTSSKKKTP